MAVDGDTPNAASVAGVEGATPTDTVGTMESSTAASRERATPGAINVSRHVKDTSPEGERGSPAVSALAVAPLSNSAPNPNAAACNSVSGKGESTAMNAAPLPEAGEEVTTPEPRGTNKDFTEVQRQTGFSAVIQRPLPTQVTEQREQLASNQKHEKDVPHVFPEHQQHPQQKQADMDLRQQNKEPQMGEAPSSSSSPAEGSLRTFLAESHAAAAEESPGLWREHQGKLRQPPLPLLSTDNSQTRRKRPQQRMQDPQGRNQQGNQQASELHNSTSLSPDVEQQTVVSCQRMSPCPSRSGFNCHPFAQGTQAPTTAKGEIPKYIRRTRSADATVNFSSPRVKGLPTFGIEGVADADVTSGKAMTQVVSSGTRPSGECRADDYAVTASAALLCGGAAAEVFEFLNALTVPVEESTEQRHKKHKQKRDEKRKINKHKGTEKESQQQLGKTLASQAEQKLGAPQEKKDDVSNQQLQSRQSEQLQEKVSEKQVDAESDTQQKQQKRREPHAPVISSEAHTQRQKDESDVTAQNDPGVSTPATAAVAVSAVASPETAAVAAAATQLATPPGSSPRSGNSQIPPDSSEHDSRTRCKHCCGHEDCLRQIYKVLLSMKEQQKRDGCADPRCCYKTRNSTSYCGRGGINAEDVAGKQTTPLTRPQRVCAEERHACTSSCKQQGDASGIGGDHQLRQSLLEEYQIRQQPLLHCHVDHRIMHQCTHLREQQKNLHRCTHTELPLQGETMFTACCRHRSLAQQIGCSSVSCCDLRTVDMHAPKATAATMTAAPAAVPPAGAPAVSTAAAAAVPTAAATAVPAAATTAIPATASTISAAVATMPAAGGDWLPTMRSPSPLSASRARLLAVGVEQEKTEAQLADDSTVTLRRPTLSAEASSHPFASQAAERHTRAGAFISNDPTVPIRHQQQLGYTCTPVVGTTPRQEPHRRHMESILVDEPIYHCDTIRAEDPTALHTVEGMRGKQSHRLKRSTYSAPALSPRIFLEEALSASHLLLRWREQQHRMDSAGHLQHQPDTHMRQDQHQQLCPMLHMPSKAEGSIHVDQYGRVSCADYTLPRNSKGVTSAWAAAATTGGLSATAATPPSAPAATGKVCTRRSCRLTRCRRMKLLEDEMRTTPFLSDQQAGESFAGRLSQQTIHCEEDVDVFSQVPLTRKSRLEAEKPYSPVAGGNRNSKRGELLSKRASSLTAKGNRSSLRDDQLPSDPTRRSIAASPFSLPGSRGPNIFHGTAASIYDNRGTDANVAAAHVDHIDTEASAVAAGVAQFAMPYAERRSQAIPFLCRRQGPIDSSSICHNRRDDIHSGCVHGRSRRAGTEPLPFSRVSTVENRATLAQQGRHSAFVPATADEVVGASWLARDSVWTPRRSSAELLLFLLQDRTNAAASTERTSDATNPYLPIDSLSAAESVAAGNSQSFSIQRVNAERASSLGRPDRELKARANAEEAIGAVTAGGIRNAESVSALPAYASSSSASSTSPSASSRSSAASSPRGRDPNTSASPTAPAASSGHGVEGAAALETPDTACALGSCSPSSSSASVACLASSSCSETDSAEAEGSSSSGQEEEIPKKSLHSESGRRTQRTSTDANLVTESSDDSEDEVQGQPTVNEAGLENPRWSLTRLQSPPPQQKPGAAHGTIRQELRLGKKTTQEVNATAHDLLKKSI